MAQYSFLKISEDGKNIIKCDNGVTGHIDIPVGITHISSEAFEYCSGIESISIPNTIKSIGRDAFCGCHNLRDVYISDLSAWLNIRFDGSCTFDGLSYPQSMANPLWYAERLFLNDEIVEDLIIPEGIESICDYAFCLYERLKSITFPKSLNKIGHGAFFRCNLESVQFFDNIHFVGFHSFQECKNLKIVSFSDGASTIGDCIGEYAFKGCINLNSISLPQSFTSIGQSAFEDCEKLELVNIPSVQELGNSCFKGCRTLSSIELPPSLIRIGCACFYDTALSYIRIPKSVSDIYPFANMNIYIDVEPGNENYISEDGSLYNTKYDRRGKMLVKYFCSSPNVSIKDVRHIGSNAFSGCKLLKSIIIDGPVDSIGSAFRGCDNLEEIILPNGITRIDGFDGCKKLSNIVIPESVVVIGERAFKDCTSLKKIVLPSQLIRIEKSAFLGCTNLQIVVVPNIDNWCTVNNNCNPLSIAHRIYDENETEITELRIPNSVNTINAHAFEGCFGIESVHIPESIENIGYQAFNNCEGLKDVTIESPNVANVLSEFKGCINIETLSIKYFNESFCLGLRCFKKLKSIYSLDNAGNRVVIDVFKILLSKAQELKLMSLFYHNLGMNLTKVQGNASDPKSFWKPLVEPGFEIEKLYHKEQDVTILLEENWLHVTGIGMVLGWNDYRAIKVYGYDDYVESVDVLKLVSADLDECLKILGLPPDYQWVIKLENHMGFNIIIKVEDYLEIDEDDLYSSVPFLNCSYIHLMSGGHIMLPPSILSCYDEYRFFCDQIPSTIPNYVNLSSVNKLLEEACGYKVFTTYNWNDREFELVEVKKRTSEIRFKEDSIQWLEACDSPEMYNSLAIRYVFGNDVQVDSSKAYELFLRSNTDMSFFNLASLTSIGFFKGTPQDVNLYLEEIDKEKIVWRCKDDLFYYGEGIDGKFSYIRKNATKYLQNNNLFLFFDTETTGVPHNYKVPSSDTLNWPRLVQLAWILTDEEGNRIHTGNLIVKPDGFVIPADATKVHGITTQRAKEEGVPLAEVIEQFKADLDMATYIVGHNIEFDKKIVGAEMIRLGMKDELEKRKSYCTMQSSIDFCKIPGKYGYKYPKLQELYKKLFGTEFDDAHNAMSDIEATEKCFWELRNRKLI